MRKPVIGVMGAGDKAREVDIKTAFELGSLIAQQSWVLLSGGFFFCMIRPPPRSTRVRSSAASDVYKRQVFEKINEAMPTMAVTQSRARHILLRLSLIHISEPTRLLSISYAVFCLKKK